MASTRLRNRRNKATGNKNTSSDEEEVTVEMSGSSTILIILLLLFIGAGSATFYITLKNPGCLWGSSSKDKQNSSLRTGPDPSPIPKVPVPSPAEAVTKDVTSPQSAPLPPPAPPAPNGFPASCTPEELNALKKQLTPDACDSAPPWTQSCSFTLATTQNGCVDMTEYFRKPMASISLATPFRAILLGLKNPNFDDSPMDMLAIGSHDYTRYSLDKWYQGSGQVECKLQPVPFAQGTKTSAPPTVHIIASQQEQEAKTKKWKAATGLTDSEIKEYTTAIQGTRPEASSTTLDAWAKETFPDQNPIHFLRLFDVDDDPGILSKSVDLLKRTWFIEFDYDWKGGWSNANLKMVIQDTLQKQAGMACYWRGTKGNLWRITDCWLDHYSKKSWAYIVCVNTQIAETKPIQTKMEEVFHETLKKQLLY